MKNKLVSWTWRRMPKKMRRFFVRLTQPSFTVSAVGIVFDSRQNVLLLKHLIRANRSGWGLPGGFLNPGEAPENALKRELKEEVGIEITNLRFIKARTIGNHVEIIFVCRAEKTDAKPRAREIIDARWFQIDEVKSEVPSVEREHIRLAQKISEKPQN
ncbi:MAG: NUDIX hydrolase [Acidobacteriota bacterium]|nr:NUDIX hydrolase [Acidobacteriota bacterium]